jgi:carbon monoxide dehydrogenase subunit G
LQRTRDEPPGAFGHTRKAETVLLEIAKDTEVAAPPDRAWQLVGDLQRLSGCIPGVTDMRELEPGKRYSATVTDKLGPFRLQLPVEIAVQSAEAPSRLVAELSGNDGRGQARVKGTVEAALTPAGSGARLTVAARLEVLGKLAALGATPMRRRADDIFEEFVRRVETELAGQT